MPLPGKPTQKRAVFLARFGAEAGQLVNNISLIFVNNATFIPTGSFISEIVARVDPVTGVVDPLTVDISWSIRGDDVTPLVSGPTTATILVGGVDPLATTIVLNGDSSLNDAIDVTIAVVP